jgi:hypothetical protein
MDGGIPTFYQKPTWSGQLQLVLLWFYIITGAWRRKQAEGMGTMTEEVKVSSVEECEVKEQGNNTREAAARPIPPVRSSQT